MKKKIILLVGAILVFGVAFAAYALNVAQETDVVKATSCCCSGGSCPMKNKDASAKAATSNDVASKHEACSCCGDSCPMKNKDASAKQASCDCCGDSCPMKAGDAAHMEVKATHSEHHKGVTLAHGPSCPMMNGQAGHKMEAGMKHEMSADGTMSCCKKAKATAAKPTL